MKKKNSKGTKRKRAPAEEAKIEEENALPSERKSDEPAAKKSKWINKERVLIFSTRGISYRDRHFMKDFLKLLPHSKTETKMDKKDKLFVINEIAEMKNCSKCVFLEARKKQDLYMWLANPSRGPSVKFMVENVHTMDELKMTGNCLKGTRAILSFDKSFEELPQWELLKELFVQTFSTPNHHPKSQPFIDHVFTFSVADNRIWFRNYQILEENGDLAEIGPRMVLNPIRIFEGSFGGPTLYQNPHYTSPNEYRSMMKRKGGFKYVDKVSAKLSLDERRKMDPKSYRLDPTDDVFNTHQN
jgi:ribosome biogenesis protein BRX1